MDTVRPTAVPPAMPVADPLVRVPRPPPPAGRTVLEPAVSIDRDRLATIQGPDREAEPVPERRGFERDAASQTLVFRVTDPSSGEVVVQIPDAAALRGRAYARREAEPAGGRVERQV